MIDRNSAWYKIDFVARRATPFLLTMMEEPWKAQSGAMHVLFSRRRAIVNKKLVNNLLRVFRVVFGPFWAARVAQTLPKRSHN